MLFLSLFLPDFFLSLCSCFRALLSAIIFFFRCSSSLVSLILPGYFLLFSRSFCFYSFSLFLCGFCPFPPRSLRPLQISSQFSCPRTLCFLLFLLFSSCFPCLCFCSLIPVHPSLSPLLSLASLIHLSVRSFLFWSSSIYLLLIHFLQLFVIFLVPSFHLSPFLLPSLVSSFTFPLLLFFLPHNYVFLLPFLLVFVCFKSVCC